MAECRSPGSTLLAVAWAVTAGLLASRRVDGATCPDGWLSYGASCYLFDPAERGYDAALAYCRRLGAGPPVVETAAENEFLRRELSERGLGFIWLGCDDLAVEGVWMCHRAGGRLEPMLYKNWSSNQPNGGSNANCISLHYEEGLWNDSRCTSGIVTTACEMPLVRPSCQTLDESGRPPLY